MKIQEKLVLESGKTLDSFEITFEVYGNLNKEKTLIKIHKDMKKND